MWEAIALAIPLGLLSGAAFVVRTLKHDHVGAPPPARTLAARPGRQRHRNLVAVLVYAAYPLATLTWLFGPLEPWVLLPWLTLPLAADLTRTVRNHSDRGSVDRALTRSGQLLLAFCMLLGAGVLVSG